MVTFPRVRPRGVFFRLYKTGLDEGGCEMRNSGDPAVIRTIALRDRCSREKKQFARNMRKKQTPAESALWEILRKKRLTVRARRQSVIRGYIVDFYIPAWKLAIEVDGSVHDSDEQKAKDAYRDQAIFRGTKIRVIRFKNADVIKQPELVLAEIKAIGRDGWVTMNS